MGGLVRITVLTKNRDLNAVQSHLRAIIRLNHDHRRQQVTDLDLPIILVSLIGPAMPVAPVPGQVQALSMDPIDRTLSEARTDTLLLHDTHQVSRISNVGHFNSLLLTI